MKRRKGILVFGCIFLFFLLSAGCNTYSSQVKEGEKEKDVIQIGVSFDSFLIERWERDRDVFVSAAKELGAQVNIQSANGDVEEQIRQIQYFIDKEVDVIMIIGVDSDALIDVVEKAKDAGIKVIAYDRMLERSNVDLYISFDNEEVGRQMAYAMIKTDPTIHNVLMFCGSKTDRNVTEVENGFYEIMQGNRINIVDKAYMKNWDPDEAAKYIYNNPDRVKQADAIMCGNDNIATTVIRALSEKRLAGVVKVAGQDADLEACQRIMEGTQIVTIYKPVEKLAKEAARAAILLAKGEKAGDCTVSDGEYEIPAMIFSPVAVTRANMYDVIIKSGFHSKEDVYMNLPKDGVSGS